MRNGIHDEETCIPLIYQKRIHVLDVKRKTQIKLSGENVSKEKGRFPKKRSVAVIQTRPSLTTVRRSNGRTRELEMKIQHFNKKHFARNLLTSIRFSLSIFQTVNVREKN